MLADDFLREDKEEGQLYLYFEHRPLKVAEKEKYKLKGAKGQQSINQASQARVFAALEHSPEWSAILGAKAPTEADPDRTVLGKHLAIYTSKNSFDYFIHKNLGGFLRRELDNYLKSEVISFDNLEADTPPSSFARDLAQVRAIKSVGEKIIDFIAQIENFQKRLWLKKKFVLETQYCITLDKIPESLYPEICGNDDQHREWQDLFAIDELEGSDRLTPEFLSDNRYLILDTRHFPRSFVDSLLAELSAAGNIEDHTTGLLVHSENFQALNLLRRRYQGKMKCVYIDPPYNTNASEILYKNDYKHSSWLSLIENRAHLARFFLESKGVFVCAIDDSEMHKLSDLLEISFPNFARNVVVVNHHPGGAGLADANLSSTHEYALFMTPAGHKILQGEGRAEGDTVKTSLMRGGSGDNNARSGRPNSFYAFLIDPNSSEVMGVEPPPAMGVEYPKEDTLKGYRRIYPVSESGFEGVWRRSYKTVRDSLAAGEIVCQNGKTLYLIKDASGNRKPLFSNWTEKCFNATVHGTNLLKKMIGKTGSFPYPKSVFTVQRCIDACLSKDSDSMILDYFAGSGTTGHAVIDMNRRDRRNRFFVLVELGHHFDDVLLPRVKKAAYSSQWKEGKPVDREGTTQLFKYIRLESYEDTLDSLSVSRPDDLLREHEEYQLRYSLSAETQASASLLGEDFVDPEKYRLSVVRSGARKEVSVDLAETFNFLLGLEVHRRRRLEGVSAIEGIEPGGERSLILWRCLDRLDASALDAWFVRHRQSFGREIRRIYVNGDHTLNASKTPEDQWEALVIEPIFRRLMFEDSGDRP